MTAADFPIDEEGVWREVRGSAAATPRPAVFLDRDGTIIDLVPYLGRPDGVRPIAAALELIAAANRAGFLVAIVTNQSGIDRGYYGWAEFAAVQRKVEEHVAAAGGRVDAIYACPRLPGELLPPPHLDPPCRKPNPGMLLAAAADLNIDLSVSWIIGDSASDLEAGRRAQVKRGWLVPTGQGGEERVAAEALARNDFEVVAGQGLAALIPRLTPSGATG